MRGTYADLLEDDEGTRHAPKHSTTTPAAQRGGVDRTRRVTPGQTSPWRSGRHPQPGQQHALPSPFDIIGAVSQSRPRAAPGPAAGAGHASFSHAGHSTAETTFDSPFSIANLSPVGAATQRPQAQPSEGTGAQVVLQHNYNTATDFTPGERHGSMFAVRGPLGVISAGAGTTPNAGHRDGMNAATPGRPRPSSRQHHSAPPPAAMDDSHQVGGGVLVHLPLRSYTEIQRDTQEKSTSSPKTARGRAGSGRLQPHQQQGIAPPSQGAGPNGKHFAAPALYTALSPPEATELMDRYGYHYTGQRDEALQKERDEAAVARRDRNKAHQADLLGMLADQRRRAAIEATDRAAAAPLSLNGVGADEPARKQRVRDARAALEGQWLDAAAAKKARDAEENEYYRLWETDWNLLEADERRRAMLGLSEEEQRRLAAEQQRQAWLGEQERVAEARRLAEEERRRIEALTLGPNVANYAERILLAEQQKRRDQQRYREELDAQIQEKHRQKRQQAAEQYLVECQLGSF